MSDNIQLLDCTLRDGGFGLEGADKNNISREEFSAEELQAERTLLSKTGIDIVELGAIEISKEDKRRFAIYQTLEAISEVIPAGEPDHRLYAALYRGPDVPLSDIPAWRKGYVEGTRVILRYSELKKSLDFCAGLAEKGYRVFVQPMLTMRYTDEEIRMLVDYANGMDAYALYFVDSYGYMESADVHSLFEKYDRGLKEDIRIGFHAHNNMNLAFANARSFLEIPTERKKIVDACILGMGQGAGNLQTELIAAHLNRDYGKNYHFRPILELCDLIGKHLSYNLWGYSVMRLIPALHRAAYKYAVALRTHYGFSYAQIDELLTDIPEDLRHRYTPDNTLELMRRKGIVPREKE